MAGQKFKYTGPEDAWSTINAWNWKQWDQVEQGRCVLHYTWMGRKSKICRGEALDWLTNSIVVPSYTGSRESWRDLLMPGGIVDYEVVHNYLKKNTNCHQVDTASIQRAALDVLEKSGLFEDVTEVQTSEVVD